MGSPSRLASRSPSGVLQKDTLVGHTSALISSADISTTPCISNVQGMGEAYPYPALAQPSPPPSPPYIMSSPSAYNPSQNADPVPRVCVASGPVDLLSASPMSPLVMDAQNYDYAVSDSHSMPYAPPTTPASSVTDTYSPISPHSPLVFPDSLEQSINKHVSAPTRSEERSRGRHRSGSRSSTDSRSCYYRTKPCRFFHNSGFCIKGDRCNFIHDYTAAGRSRPSGGKSNEEQPATSKSDEDRTFRRPSHAHTEAKRSNMGSSSPTGSSSGTNYYPITWRVIGGGVLMSGPREVCQAYLAGRCGDGLDCRFSHPSATDELAHSIAFTPRQSSEPYYPFIDTWSPVSPLHVHPFALAQMGPPSPVTEDGYDDVAKKTLAIDTYVARSVSQYFPARVVLDGSTLLPRDSLAGDAFIENETSSPSDSRSPSPDPSLADEVGARAIPRPVSTPPYASSSFSKVVRLFAAEMP